MSTRTDASPVRRAALIAALLAAALGLAACSSGADSAEYSGADAGYDAQVEAEERAAAEDGATGGDAAPEGEASDDRAVIVTGAMYITVEDPVAAAREATRVVERAGGRVDARSEQAPTDYDGGSAWLTLRIPSTDLDAVVEELRTLGTVDEFSTSSSDVTREVTDLEARISTLRASTARLEGLLTEAEDIEDIITLENELARRQAELEGLEARERGLGDQVSLSTIDLSLTTEPVVPVDDSPRSFWSGLQSGWDALVGLGAGALVVTGVLLPWIGVTLVIGAAVLLGVRASRSRRTRGAAPVQEPAGAAADAPGSRDDAGPGPAER